jgi:hypothetical protein
MKKYIKPLLIFVLIVVAAYYGFGYINSYFGWYSHKHWTQRKGSTDINEAKNRKVFIKQLHFSVEGYSGNLFEFIPFIEKAYTWGHDTSEETVRWTNTNYPYQIGFSYKRTSNFGVLISDKNLKRVDSSDSSWLYLKQPILKDTLVLEVGGEKIPRGAIIKVYD